MPNRESAIGRFLCLLLKKYQINTARRRWKSYFLACNYNSLYFDVSICFNCICNVWPFSSKSSNPNSLNLKIALCSLFATNKTSQNVEVTYMSHLDLVFLTPLQNIPWSDWESLHNAKIMQRIWKKKYPLSFRMTCYN